MEHQLPETRFPWRARGLEPEYLAWSADDATLFVNLQENNAVAIIDVAGQLLPMP